MKFLGEGLSVELFIFPFGVFDGANGVELVFALTSFGISNPNGGQIFEGEGADLVVLDGGDGSFENGVLVDVVELGATNRPEDFVFVATFDFACFGADVTTINNVGDLVDTSDAVDGIFFGTKNVGVTIVTGAEFGFENAVAASFDTIIIRGDSFLAEGL